MGEFDDVIAEFLVESREGLDQLDRDLVALEETPDDRDLLGRIFRCFHTVKGTSGFLGFSKLESLTHAGESLLSRMRDGELRPSAGITSALLETVDAVRFMLGEVEASGNDGEADYSVLTEQLKALCRGEELPEPAAAPPAAAAEPEPEPELAAAPEPATASEPAAALEPAAASEPAAAPEPAAASEPAAVSEPAPASPPMLEIPKPTTPAEQRAAAELLAMPAPQAASPASQPERKAEEPHERHAAAVPESVRVDLTLLDNLVDLAGELVLTRNHIVQLSKGREDTALSSATQRLNFVTAQLQDGIMRMRMQPVNNLFSKFPRVVRDLARSCRKLVRLELDGRDTELDKSLIETIKDPMVHLLRNCVDHGIEPPDVRQAKGKHPEGRIVLRAYHQNGLVHIEVADDGGGIALSKVKKRGIDRGLVTPERAEMMSDSEIASLIFLPGFSTAEAITNVSGRGVGMDVVKTNVEQVGGTVEVDTREGYGTTFILKIPLTLAIVPALVVRCADARYAIPQVNVIELVRLNSHKQALEWIHGVPVFRLRGKLLPVVFLEEAMGGHIMPPAANDNAEEEDNSPSQFLAVVQGPGRQFGLVVDAVLDQQEIVVKPLPKLLAEIGAFAGATLLGDGRVALILDILGIAQRARLVSELREDAMLERARAQEQHRGKGLRTLLLLQGPDDARLAVPLEEVSRLETVDVNQLESGGQHLVLQYRGEIMPLLRTSELLPERRMRMRNYSEAVEPTSISVVVLGKPGRALGLVVDDVLDVVETTCELRRMGCRQGVVGTLVVQNRVTEVLDLPWLISAAGLDMDEGQSLAG